jgi:glycopeptide antibiotics resistance protein
MGLARRVGIRLAFLVWLCAWVWIGVPWGSFQWTPSFERVEVIPFTIEASWTQALNVLAFVPVGLLGARLAWAPRKIVLVGAGLSAATELLQLFSRTRYPQTTDFILNTAGALAGMTIATYSMKRRHH